MSDFIKDACKSLAYTTNSFSRGACIENFKSHDNAKKGVAILVTAVAAIGVGILMGAIPTIGSVISVPVALIVGLYAFARYTQPDRGKDEMEAMSWATVLERIKNFKCFTEFDKLGENKQYAIITLTAITALSVGTISGAMLGGVPVLGALAAVALAALAGLIVFSYLSASSQGLEDKIKIAFSDSDQKAARLKRDAQGTFEAFKNVVGGLAEAAGGVSSIAKKVAGKGATPSQEPVPSN